MVLLPPHHCFGLRRVVSQLALGMVACVHYLSIWEAEARALPWVPGQPGWQSEIHEQTNKKDPISGDRKESGKCEDYGIGRFSSKMLEVLKPKGWGSWTVEMVQGKACLLLSSSQHQPDPMPSSGLHGHLHRWHAYTYNNNNSNNSLKRKN